MYNINIIILFLKIVNSILLILFEIINQNKYHKLYSILKKDQSDININYQYFINN